MALLEIERKFAFYPSLLSWFRRNEGVPPFTDLQCLGIQTIHDVYFDKRVAGNPVGILAQNGIWVRQRDKIWQAKQRVPAPAAATNTQYSLERSKRTQSAKSESFLRTVFTELSCPLEIHTLITNYIPSSPPADRDFGLQPVADFITFRESFLANKYFHVVLDETCFGHRVGEVEVLAKLGTERQAQQEIDSFMEKYRWFFLSRHNKGKVAVKGKLTAYFEKFPPKF